MEILEQTPIKPLKKVRCLSLNSHPEKYYTRRKRDGELRVLNAVESFKILMDLKLVAINH